MHNHHLLMTKFCNHVAIKKLTTPPRSHGLAYLYYFHCMAEVPNMLSEMVIDGVYVWDTRKMTPVQAHHKVDEDKVIKSAISFSGTTKFHSNEEDELGEEEKWFRALKKY